MVIDQQTAFVGALAIAAMAGFKRGWGREVITCAIILGTVLFLSNGGDQMISQFVANLFHGHLPGTATAEAAGTGTAAASQTVYCSPVTTKVLSGATFTGMSFLGYRTGYRHGSPAKHYNHRIAGVIPGTINGAAIAYYLSHSIFPGTQISLAAPDAATTTSNLPVVFGIGFVALLGLLFVVAQNGKK